MFEDDIENMMDDLLSDIELKKSNKKRKTSKKFGIEWKDEIVDKLISLVEQHECLWDAGSELYHNKNSRDSAWAEIINDLGFDTEGMGLDAKDLSNKWSNLRIQYRGYASKSKLKSGQAAVSSPKWKFFKAMSFNGRAEEEQRQPTICNLEKDDIAAPTISRSSASNSRCSSSDSDLVMAGFKEPQGQ